MKQNKLNFLLVIALVLGIGLACNFHDEKPAENKPAAKNQKLESYTLKGLKFAYYKIPANLSREDLINTATELHRAEPDTQLILVDDDSGLAAYVKYAKDFSGGKTEGEMPKEWADRHIVANLQKYLSGKFMLCEGNGYKEIAEIK
jgi:hypothetical protein